MFCKHLLVYINSKVPFHENLPPLPSHRSRRPCVYVRMKNATVEISLYTKNGFVSHCFAENFPSTNSNTKITFTKTTFQPRFPTFNVTVVEVSCRLWVSTLDLWPSTITQTHLAAAQGRGEGAKAGGCSITITFAEGGEQFSGHTNLEGGGGGNNFPDIPISGGGNNFPDIPIWGGG